MSWARINRVKAGLPYFASSWFVDRVIKSLVLMRSPSMSKIQARITGKLVAVFVSLSFTVLLSSTASAHHVKAINRCLR